MKEILEKVLRKINQKCFDYSLLGVLKTPPINYKQDTKVTILTMLGHSTVNMYLVAIKTFMRQFGYGSIEVINDGTLTDSDIATLKHHVPNIRLSNASDVDTLSCPTYISWKRLLHIAELAKNSYVIQLDSDTISLAPLIDVHENVQANRGFLIGSDRWKQGIDVNFLNNIVGYWTYTHVQAQAEIIFKELDFFKDGTKYLRACAGFSGYPKNFASPHQIEKLSQQIEEKIGKNWHEWGSEQTATMCLISKTPNSSVLPWPKYQNFMQPVSGDPVESASLIHFIGSTRYRKGKYIKLVKCYIKRNTKFS